MAQGGIHKLQMDYFMRGRCSPRRLNIANTVLVNFGDGTWYLGYAQDARDNAFFIDFDCVKIKPLWVGSQHVWQHQLLSDDYETSATNSGVYVALRNEKQDPYVFHPGVILSYSPRNCWMCCVRVASNGTEENTVGHFDVVHRWQLIAKLPSLTDRFDRVPYVRHVISLANCPSLKAVDAHQINTILNHVYRNNEDGTEPGLDRLFVRIDEYTITFLMWHIEIYQLPMQSQCGDWTTISSDRIYYALDAFCRPEQLFTIDLREVEICRTTATITASLSGNEAQISIIPLEILWAIMEYLDLHSKASAKRVCVDWKAAVVLSQTSCVLLDLRGIDFYRPGHQSGLAMKGYHLGVLLNWSITPKSKALVLLNAGYKAIPVVSTVLSLKRTVLPVILLRNCSTFSELFIYKEHFPFSGEPRQHYCATLSPLVPHCKRLLVFHWTVWFHVCQCYQSRPSALQDFRGVVIPSLALDNSMNSAEIVKCFIKFLPPAPSSSKERFRNFHGRLLKTMPYPEGWQNFRYLLRSHAFTDKPPADRFWDDLDLRNFEELPLNRLVIDLVVHYVDTVYERISVEDVPLL
ncbi:uncharacterized protein LOC129598762 isoform X3 [Paramacrobiotus metropolitanus]|uniref:uncharacterized protein LOC129598762 isoform X3 n=1 Tax=Paramacrobiotus metropolitanus TaxID=2943436 RepID=UPI002445F9BF|nr:uncharacterized protein LOC129598762 isoform X3 [Paramacrobiotus metropolitanus]